MSDSPPLHGPGGRFPSLSCRPFPTWTRRLLVVAALASLGFPAVAETKLPLPRFASLKSNEVNLRTGPSEDQPKLWVYQRAGMPVEIIEEFDTWRKVRDHTGEVGWVSAALLSGKRTAIITETQRTLHENTDTGSRAVALLDPGVIAQIEECSGAWCRLEVKGYEGYVQRGQFWGAYPDEDFKE